MYLAKYIVEVRRRNLQHSMQVQQNELRVKENEIEK